jgi:hypothetical protein
MAISFPHHRTRFGMLLARGFSQSIKQASQPEQCIHVDPRHVTIDNARTGRLVEHPARHIDAKL